MAAFPPPARAARCSVPRWSEDPILPPFKTCGEFGRGWHLSAAWGWGSGFTRQQDAGDNQSRRVGEKPPVPRGVVFRA